MIKQLENNISKEHSSCLGLAGNGKEELELGRQLVFGVETI